MYSWVAGLWIRGQTVKSTVVCGRSWAVATTTNNNTTVVCGRSWAVATTTNNNTTVVCGRSWAVANTTNNNTTVDGRRLLYVLGPHSVPLAGGVFEVGLLLPLLIIILQLFVVEVGLWVPLLIIILQLFVVEVGLLLPLLIIILLFVVEDCFMSWDHIRYHLQVASSKLGCCCHY